MDNNGQQWITMDNNPWCYMHLWCRFFIIEYLSLIYFQKYVHRICLKKVFRKHLSKEGHQNNKTGFLGPFWLRTWLDQGWGFSLVLAYDAVGGWHGLYDVKQFALQVYSLWVDCFLKVIVNEWRSSAVEVAPGTQWSCFRVMWLFFSINQLQSAFTSQ